MKYEIIEAGDAAPRPRPSDGRTNMIRQMIGELMVGKVAKIELEGPETTMGIKGAVSRVAASMNKGIIQWHEGHIVYVELQGRPPQQRLRPPRFRDPL